MYTDCARLNIYSTKEEALKASSKLARKVFIDSTMEIIQEQSSEFHIEEVPDFRVELSNEDIIEEMRMFLANCSRIYKITTEEVKED